MLKHLRKKGVSKKILWVVAFVIVISFGFFGTANYLRNDQLSGAYAGSIFGQKIPLKDFQENYHHARNQALLQYGENFNKVSQFLNLEAETWDRLILFKEAQRRHIKVSNKEVVAAIENYPVFQRNGKFDSLLYNDILRYAFQTKPRDFEEGMRGTLMFNKIYLQEVGEVQISDEELKETYRKQNEKVQISYALVPFEDFKKDVNVSQEEARQYYETYKNALLLPPRVNVEFIKFAYPENATPEAKDALEKTVQEAAQVLAQNPDLKGVAQKYKQELKESGLFSEEQPNLNLGWSYEVLKKTFELEPGILSDAIETEEGYYILRVKEKKNSQIPEFAEAREKITEVLKNQKAQEAARAKAQEYAEEIKKQASGDPDKKFADLVQAFNLTVRETPSFNRGQYLPAIGISKEFQDAAFSLNEQSPISSAVEIAKGYAVLHLDSGIPIDEAQYEKDKEKFRSAFLIEKTNEKFNELMIRLRLKSNLQDNISRPQGNAASQNR